MTINKALKDASELIDYIDSKILLKYVLKQDENYIIINRDAELDESVKNKYVELVKKVKNGYPLQYITNKQEFMGMNFYVDENVLIPQPDTEVLVQKTIEYAKNKPNCKILDLCTGSGNIAISIKKYLADVEVTGIDISEKALEIAKKNANQNNVDVKFIKSNMFENIYERFDIIVSNPPYIKTNIISTLPINVQKEPNIALDGGDDGLNFYKIIAENINNYLEKDGILLVEIGYDQKEEVTKLFKNSRCIKDYENRDRVIIWSHSQEK